MSKENLDQFIQKVTDDEQLQARIGEEIHRVKCRFGCGSNILNLIYFTWAGAQLLKPLLFS